MLKVNNALVTAHDVSLKAGARMILDKVNLAVRPGEIVTIIGPNGAGKSTLVKVLLGLVPHTAGRVEKPADLRIGYVPQRFPIAMNVPLSVRRLMTLTLSANAKEISAALDETGVAHLIDAWVTDLSGGELQRVLLARALLRRPQLLVLDEPVQAVDFHGEVKLYELISAIRKAHGCGILMVSHDLHMVMAESDHVICLNSHVCCEGGPTAVQKDPEFAKLFGPAAARMIAAYTHHHDHDHETHSHLGHDHGHDHQDHHHGHPHPPGHRH
ncbi:ATP-binding cassette domain-containing protein [Aestuariivirga sp.]|uniref:ATP-binding cassette domain-containing protein n=1 Tax=Aestuariivirga sp. TaxID=2650926 RepID=UPI0039E4647A